MKTEIDTLMVVGTGLMGSGIAQIAANSGCTVLLYDKAEGAAEGARKRIGESLQRALAKGYVTAADIERTLANLHPVAALADAGRADAVIEAVKEDLAVKQAVFAELEAVVGADTHLWTNTSMISITRIAENLKHPERVAGTHFFNPVPRMQLVEVIAGARSSEETLQVAIETAKRWGKTPVRAPDTPGFLANRILDAIKREALALVDEGADPEAVDTAVRLGLNFPMGPFQIMDLVGLDTTLDCLVAQAKGMNRSTSFSPKLVQKVKAHNLGRKTGQGFYSY